MNYGGVYNFGSREPVSAGLPSSLARCKPTASACPATSSKASAIPATRSPTSPWDCSGRIPGACSHNLTVNYGVRYDVEFPPTSRPRKDWRFPAITALGLQKGIQTDKNNIQPRIGVAWDPKGDGKTVVRASFGMFYDHPLLGLYFLGDASDGSTSGQLAFAGTGFCSGCRQCRQPERDPDLPRQPHQSRLAGQSCAVAVSGYQRIPICSTQPEPAAFQIPESSQFAFSSTRTTSTWPRHFLPLASSPSGIRRPRTSSMPTRSKRT